MKAKKKAKREVKWIKELRSGEYSQSGGQLKNESGFCCLGVGCKIFLKPDEWKDSDKISQKLRIKLGLKTDSGTYTINNTRYSLTSKNDNGKTFNEIADIITSIPKNLFKGDVEAELKKLLNK